MSPLDRDAAYLWDMLEAAREVTEFVRSVQYNQYLSDKMMRRAVERSVELIGEAARRVSAEFKEQHPEIPWGLIVGQRNVLVHDYGEVRHERIWAVAANRVPELIAKLEFLVPAPPEQDEDA